MSTLVNERTVIKLTRQLVVANGETALLRVGRHLEFSVDNASDAGAVVNKREKNSEISI